MQNLIENTGKKNKKKYRTLKTTLFFMSMGPILVVFLVGIGFSFVSQTRTMRNELNSLFNTEADRKMFEYNECLNSTIRTVDSMSEYILSSLNEKQLLTDPDYERDYMNSLAKIMADFTRTSKDSVASYFRMNAEKYGPRQGVFLIGTNKSGYISIRPTDLSLYSPTDLGHVAWYYMPVWEGQPVWLDPYENQNINMHIVSYVKPIRKNGNFLGVVGIDLNMATLKNIANDIRPDQMTSLILGKDYSLVYNSNNIEPAYSVDANLDIRRMRPFLESSDVQNVFECTWAGQRHYGMCRNLKNGMKIVLLMPSRVLVHRKFLNYVKFAVVLIITISLGAMIMRYGFIHIILPINELTEASYRLSRGELGIPIAYHSNNELGILSDSIRKMAEQLHEYIEYIREQAKSEREAKESAINASKAKSNFLANMSHEIRTPINAVLGMNEMILRETARDDIRTYSLNIKHAGNALLALVNDVLDFSKIESGKMEILADSYDLSSMLTDLISIISERIEKNGLEFKLNINKDIPCRLYGDSAKIKQCILNLLTNAVKYTNKGSVTFGLDFVEIPYSDGRKISLRVKISDTGIGIKKEDLDKLFQPFERIEENRNRTVEGTGLGMSIVQRILEVMDTKLEIQSEYGVGSTFAFSVVQDVVSDEPLGDIMEKYNQNARMMETYKEKLFAPEARLLFVDDTVMNLEVVKGLLKNTLIKLDTVLSGEEALEMVKKKTYDILFIDHRMPRMDGLETLEALNNMTDNKSLGKPCIALTANAISGAKEMYLEAGFTDYLSKPVSPDKLEEMIRKYLPKELIKTPEEIEDSGLKPAAEEASMPDIEGIDMASARTYCGSTEMMKKMFALFQSSIQKNADELEALLKDENIIQYRIKVHALKSSARTIGANKLSEMALALENAASEEDLEIVKKETPDLLKLYRSYDERLAVFNQDDEDGGSASGEAGGAAGAQDAAGAGVGSGSGGSAGAGAGGAGSGSGKKRSGKAPLKEGQLKEILDSMAQSAADFNLDDLEKMLGELQMHQLPDDFKEDYKKLRAAILDVDFDGVTSVLEDIFTRL